MTETMTRAHSAARRVTVCDDGRIELDDGTTARRAIGCLVRPEPGDRALVWRCPESGDAFVLSVLERPGDSAVVVDAGDRLTLRAAERLSLSCGGEVTIAAPLGAISLIAGRLTLSAIDGLTMVARAAMATADTWMIQARDVLTTRARHHLMSATKEMRLEADRIQLS